MSSATAKWATVTALFFWGALTMDASMVGTLHRQLRVKAAPGLRTQIAYESISLLQQRNYRAMITQRNALQMAI